jgi:stage V sporulation protein SpoVS
MFRGRKYLKIINTVAIIFCLVVSTSVVSKKRKSKKRAPIWNFVDSKARKELSKRAKQDALDKLYFKVCGYNLGKGITVYDFMLNSGSIKQKVDSIINNAEKYKKQKYTKYGSVNVYYKINFDGVIDSIKQDAELKNNTLVEIKNKITKEQIEIKATGYAAVKGSLGMKKIVSKFVAEFGAVKALIGIFMNLKIDESNKVKDLVKDNEKMQNSIVAYIKGIKPKSVDYAKVYSECEVFMNIPITDAYEKLAETIKLYSDKKDISVEQIRNANKDIKLGKFIVTGLGKANKETQECYQAVYEINKMTSGAGIPLNKYTLEITEIKKHLSAKQ